MNYDDLYANGELTDAGLDYALEVDGSDDRTLPNDMPAELKALIEEAIAAFDGKFAEAFSNG
ncbi:MAG: hypothetical protein KME14_20390 [Tildeniella torsiva UHER 1998/13D]|jgi:hypothetical protein|nr:hypothetical protein [Tildeniella torsiva UHER 1998/13D]